MTRSLPAILVATVVLAGCATASDAPRAPRPSANHITAEELVGREHLNALEAVESLRPAWIRPRGLMSLQPRQSGEVIVYVDGIRVGGPGNLRSLRAEHVGHMEYLDSRDATTRYGTGHPGGAILVTTRRG